MNTNIEARVLGLERRLRTQRALTTGLVALLALVGLTAAQGRRPQNDFRILSVERLEVTDSSGRVVFRVGHTPAGGHLELVGPTGRNVFEIMSTRSGPHLVMSGHSGRTVARISGGENGGQLELLNAEARPAVLMGSGPSAGGVAVKDTAGRTLVGIGRDPDGNGRLEVLNVEKRVQRAFGF